MSIMILPVLAQVIVGPPPAPPVFTVAPPVGVANQRRGERFTVDVEVKAGAELLWSGTMVVASGQGSSFTRRLAEPAPDDCPNAGYGQQLENSLSVQVNPQRQVNGDGALGVSVRWGRTQPGACPFRASSRSVELGETVVLAPGQAATLTGDGGLTVRLRRRQG